MNLHINKKLIRDKIPEIMELKGQKADFYIAGKKDYKDELYKKLLEESSEVIEEKNNKDKLKEELGDLLEVFETILKLEKIDIEEIKSIKNKKKKEKGGFDEKIILNF